MRNRLGLTNSHVLQYRLLLAFTLVLASFTGSAFAERQESCPWLKWGGRIGVAGVFLGETCANNQKQAIEQLMDEDVENAQRIEEAPMDVFNEISDCVASAITDLSLECPACTVTCLDLPPVPAKYDSRTSKVNFCADGTPVTKVWYVPGYTPVECTSTLDLMILPGAPVGPASPQAMAPPQSPTPSAMPMPQMLMP